jgi:hypothetical protein
MIRYIKTSYPAMEVIGGNVVTSTQVMHLIEAGVDAVRVGMGAGSVSTSQLIKAVGRAQCSAIYHTVSCVASHRVASCRSASHRIASHHVASRRIVSHFIALRYRPLSAQQSPKLAHHAFSSRQAKICNRYGIPVIADGGLKSSGAVMKALAMVRACGHVGMWACGHVGMWACGHVGLWACGRLGMWACGHVDMWNVGIWACGHVGMWACGHVCMWTCGLC